MMVSIADSFNFNDDGASRISAGHTGVRVLSRQFSRRSTPDRCAQRILPTPACLKRRLSAMRSSDDAQRHLGGAQNGSKSSVAISMQTANRW
jgi:hypothetical protein